MSTYQIRAAASFASVANTMRLQMLGRVLAVGIVMVAMMLLAQWVWQSTSPLGFNDDAAQTLSTAAQWQKGEGLTTTVLYYDSQLDQVAPAKQTVWPPALAVVTAAVADMSGLALSKALLVVLLLAHLLTAAGIGLVAAMSWRTAPGHTDEKWWAGLAATFFWLVSVPAVLGVARGLSEPLYLAFALLALLALQCAVSVDETPVWQRPGRRQWPWLMVASVAVSAALLTRYQAVALIGPLLMAAAMVGAPGTPASQRIRIAGAVSALPLLTIATLFWRNWIVTGGLTGGASASSGQSLTEMAARMSWVPSPWQPVVMSALLGSMLLAGLIALVLWTRGFNGCRSTPARLSRRVRTGLVFCLSAYAVNLALMVALGLMSTVYSLEFRYLTINLLLLVLPVTVVLQQLNWHRTPGLGFRLQIAMVVGLAGIALLQSLALKPVVESRLASAPPAQIAKILSTPLIKVSEGAEEVSLLTWLAAQASAPNLLSSNAQSLSLALHALQAPVGTVLGLPLPVFTDRNWDSQHIEALVADHSIDLVVGFRQVPTWVFPDPLDTWLYKTNGNLPWLEPVSATQGLFLGRIHKPVNSSLCGPLRSDKLATTVAHLCD